MGIDLSATSSTDYRINLYLFSAKPYCRMFSEMKRYTRGDDYRRFQNLEDKVLRPHLRDILNGSYTAAEKHINAGMSYDPRAYGETGSADCSEDSETQADSIVPDLMELATSGFSMGFGYGNSSSGKPQKPVPNSTYTGPKLKTE